MSSVQDVTLRIRTGFTETVSVTLSEDSVPIDITGRTYALQVRATADASTTLASFTCSIVDAAAGEFACTLSATETAALTPGGGVYDLAETYGTTKTPIIAGTAIIEKGVTR